MNAAEGREEQEVDKEAVVPVATAGVDPRAVMVHLHDTPETEAAEGSSVKAEKDCKGIGCKDETNARLVMPLTEEDNGKDQTNPELSMDVLLDRNLVTSLAIVVGWCHMDQSFRSAQRMEKGSR